MRMARVNVYLPDALAEQAKAAGLNISRVTQEAIGSALAHSETDRWLTELGRRPGVNVPNRHIVAALDQARAELGERAGS
jgi:post-segregation antitoxin (ccd killing protein)